MSNGKFGLKISAISLSELGSHPIWTQEHNCVVASAPLWLAEKPVTWGTLQLVARTSSVHSRGAPQLDSSKSCPSITQMGTECKHWTKTDQQGRGKQLVRNHVQKSRSHRIFLPEQGEPERVASQAAQMHIWFCNITQSILISLSIWMQLAGDQQSFTKCKAKSFTDTS